MVFVADRPNPRKNLDVTVPFVGTKSYKTLLDWVYRMDLDVNEICTTNACDEAGSPKPISYWPDSEFRFIALGIDASNYLDAVEIKHFVLPLPASKTNKQEISRLLYRCKKYIYKK